MHYRYRQQLWAQIVTEARDQYLALKQNEKDWLEARLGKIAYLQQQLNHLFVAAKGEQHCQNCAGGCCHAGHNHMNLVNLLQYFSCQEQPPDADFYRNCPFLGDKGCLLSVGRRPYNCISFICDIIETSLSEKDLATFYRLEGELRRHYLAVAQRYEGAAMTGLLLQYRRLQERSFFQLKSGAKAEGNIPCH